MELILPEGTVTWMRRGSKSTLDLAFVSKELEDSILECHPADELEASSDHIPILTKLRIKPPTQKTEEPRTQWKKADWEKVNQRLSTKLEELTRSRTPLSTTEAIDQRVAKITRIIHQTAEELIPKVKPSTYAKPYWTTECSRLVKEARKARRRWTTEGSEESWIAYNKATNRKKSQIKKDKAIGWRAVVAEATNDPNKIWKLSKWARRDSKDKKRLPQIPDILDATGKVYTQENDKAKAMAKHFFIPPHPPVQANLQDIEKYKYPKEIELIARNIEESEVKNAIRKLPNGKAPGPDGIPNTARNHLVKYSQNCTTPVSP